MISWAFGDLAMKKEALAYLSCPQCNSNFKLQEIAESSLIELGIEEIVSAKICCSNGHQFDVVRGVPRLIADQLSGVVDLHTGKKFSESWTQFSRYHQEYIRQFFDWLSPLSPEFVRDKVVLDAGCGKGRHSRVLNECGARVIVAVDIGDSVDVAYANLRDLPNVHVVQGDIKALPVKPIFDLIYSVGVLHHMNHPAAGFRALVQKLNQFGTLAIWVYGKENNGWITGLVDPMRKLITSRLPKSLLRYISMMLAWIVFHTAQSIYKPWHAMQQKISFLPPLFYQAYLLYISRFDFEEIDNIVYDHLVAPVAYYLSREEVKSWGDFSPFLITKLRWHNQNSWTLIVSNDANVFSEAPPAAGSPGPSKSLKRHQRA